MKLDKMKLYEFQLYESKLDEMLLSPTGDNTEYNVLKSGIEGI